jgi:hypothetical protein
VLPELVIGGILLATGIGYWRSPERRIKAALAKRPLTRIVGARDGQQQQQQLLIARGLAPRGLFLLRPIRARGLGPT